MIRVYATSILLAVITAYLIFAISSLFSLPEDLSKMLCIFAGTGIFVGFTFPALEKVREEKAIRARRSRLALVENPTDKSPRSKS